MRSYALLLAALLAVSPGCMSEDEAPSATDAPSMAAGNATAPAPLHFEGDVTVGADPFNLVDGSPCSTDASTCYKHDFTIAEANGTFDVEATLAWMIAANDFDLYLYEGEQQISSDGINSVPPAATAPPTTQVLHHNGLGPGEYSLWVVAWNAAADSYTLDVTFS